MKFNSHSLNTDGPELTKGASVLAGALETSIKLICGTKLVGNPKPTISWRDNAGSVMDESSSRFSKDDGPSQVSLTVRGLRKNDAGMWVCIVTVEDVGVIEHNIDLVVVGKK